MLRLLQTCRVHDECYRGAHHDLYSACMQPLRSTTCGFPMSQKVYLLY